jgi:hypothetical protein
MKAKRKYFKTSPLKTEHLIFKVSPEEKQFIMDEAIKEDISISQYIRNKIGYCKK